MTRYIVTHWSEVFAICNVIKSASGEIFAINAPTTKPGESADKREIWFFCKLSEIEILRKLTESDIQNAAEIKISEESDIEILKAAENRSNTTVRTLVNYCP